LSNLPRNYESTNREQTALTTDQLRIPRWNCYNKVHIRVAKRRDVEFSYIASKGWPPKSKLSYFVHIFPKY